MKIHRDRRSDAAGRQRTARRFAVGRRRRWWTSPDVLSHAGGRGDLSLGASSTLDGLPGPPGGALLPSRLPRPITATSAPNAGPRC